MSLKYEPSSIVPVVARASKLGRRGPRRRASDSGAAPSSRPLSLPGKGYFVSMSAIQYQHVSNAISACQQVCQQRRRRGPRRRASDSGAAPSSRPPSLPVRRYWYFISTEIGILFCATCQ